MRDVNGMRQMGDLVDRNLDRQDHLSARRLAGFQHWKIIILCQTVAEKLPESSPESQQVPPAGEVLKMSENGIETVANASTVDGDLAN